MRPLVIALAVVLTGAYAWAQDDFTASHAQGDGVRLAFMQAGAGPLIVFLHGHPDDWTLYTMQTPAANSARPLMAVAPNLRGSLPSEVPQAVDAYTMPHLLNDVHGLLNHFGRERCVLVGNDWGGYIAWVFASAYPNRVERLVILNAPHPAIHLRNVRTDPAQNRASQYERAYNAALSPYPVWYNYYRADPIKTPATLAEAAATGRLIWLHTSSPVSLSRQPPCHPRQRADLSHLGYARPPLLPSQLSGLERMHRTHAWCGLMTLTNTMRSHPTLVNQTM
jgi:pimeloyl-ACP methyl ester carboxylesterase